MWGGEPDYVDPALATGTIGSWTLLRATCAKLFNTLPDPDTGRTRVAPEVVRSYRRSPTDGRTYTFELKRTFRFHNRAPVTARSFADAFNRNASPKHELSCVSAAASCGRSLGADAVMAGKATSISGVQVLGRYRLRVRLKRRAGDFLARLTMPSFCPILPRTPIDPAGMDNPPGSGPYYIADRVPNRRIVLERNPYYGGGRTANPDRIVWTIEPDRGERLRATEQDENDFMGVFDVPGRGRPQPQRQVRPQPARRSVLPPSEPLELSLRVQPTIDPRSRAPARPRSGRRSTTHSTGRP